MKLFSLLLSAWALLLQPAMAQDWPTRPLRLIVPFAPGGGNDTVARAVATQLASSLGQPVVVENRAGAGGVVGADMAAKAAPDGYTLFLGGVGSLAVNPHIVPKISYDALKDFVPVVLLASAPSVVAVSPKVPYKTLQEMTAYARGNPAKINFASNGNGSSAHIATALFETMAGVDMTHVPYKGLGPAMNDLLSGQVDIMFSSVVAITPQIKAGKLRALAVTTAKRSALLPDVPTLAELGLTGYEAGSWYGLLVPAGTPEAIVRRLNAESVKALRGGSVRDSLSSEGAEVIGSTPEEFARHIRAEHARVGKMIKDGRLKMEQ